MLSRIADAFYWMERYRERAENIARFIDVNHNLNMDIPQNKDLQWAPIVYTTGDYNLFESLYKTPNEKNVLEFLTFDTRNPNSIINCLAEARENARAIRQTIITEMWQELNTLYIFVQQASRNRKKILSTSQFYDRIKRQSQLMVGIRHASMSHNEAWHFGLLGSLLERADKTSRILDVKYFILLPSLKHVGTPYDNIHWMALLKSATGFEMFKKVYRRVTPENILNFLIFDREFPRSIHFCIRNAYQSLNILETTYGHEPNSKPKMLLEQLQNEMNTLSTKDIIDRGVHEYLNQIQIRLIDINNSIYKTFFSPYDFEQ